MISLSRIAFTPARKPYQIGLRLTDKNGDFGAISVQRSEIVPRRSLKRRVTYQIVVHTIKDSLSCWHEQLGIVEHSLRQFRPQSLCYPVFRERVTDALEDSSRVSVAVWWTKTGTRKSWFRINCACVKLFTYLTKRSYRSRQCRSKVRFIWRGGGESQAPKTRAARGVRGHAHPEDFKLYGLSNSIVSLHRAFIPSDFSLLKP